MADQINFEEARARQWQADVNAEFEETNSLLAELAPVLEQYDEEDDILAVLKENGQMLEEKYQNLIEGFTDTVHIIDNVVEKVVEGIFDGIEVLKELAEKLK